MSKEESAEDGAITMVVSDGLFILGKLVDGNKLLDPRVFQIIDSGQKMQLSPLPGIPSAVFLGKEGLRYSLSETPGNKNLFKLYYQVTHPRRKDGLQDQEDSLLSSVDNLRKNWERN